MMSWKGCGSGHGLILRYYPSICMEGLRKTTKTLTHDSWSTDRDLNQGAPKYEAGVLTALPLCSVQHHVFAPIGEGGLLSSKKTVYNMTLGICYILCVSLFY
jgi:hypothetical protein